MPNFPPEILALPIFEGQFTANKLAADNCDVLFASYPAGTRIPAHTHDTDNIGVITAGALWLSVDGAPEVCYKSGAWYHVGAGVSHSARFDVETAEIEFWFKGSAA
jgi:quercetin dioxygenase-like cupin family protein